MGKGLNKAQLIGNVGKDAEVRYTGSGKAVASFSIATSESWRDKSGEQHEKTEWHNIVVWDKLAEICGEWVKKGKRVYIEGKIQNRSYDDKDGNKKYVSEIVASEMILLSDNQRGESSESRTEYRAPQASAAAPKPVSFDDTEVVEDDLPF